MTSGAQPSKQAGMTISRRGGERFDVGRAPFCATWLSERQKVSGEGVLLDISSGGFGARMIDAPVHGRLLHTKFTLPLAADQMTCPIEADARVCGRVPVTNEATPEWIVHFAIESMHPVDEKRMAQAIRWLKVGAA